MATSSGAGERIEVVFGRLASVDLAVASLAECELALVDVVRVQRWASAVKAKATTARATRIDSQRATSPEPDPTPAVDESPDPDSGSAPDPDLVPPVPPVRSAQEEARAAAVRRAAELLSAFGDALEAGVLTEQHLVVVDRFSPKDRMRTAAAELLAAATSKSAEEFGVWLNRWHADRDVAEGISRIARQQRLRKVTTWPDVDDMFNLRATLPAVEFEALKRTLNAIADRLEREGCLDRAASWNQRLADALMEMAYLARAAMADPGARSGGESLRTAVVVFIDYDVLVGGLGHEVTVDGFPVDVHEVRRLAAEAHIIPMVLGGDGEVLDMGRAQRYAGDAQWLAAIAEQGGCWRHGCVTPVGSLDVHHLHEFADGGPTDHLNHGVGCRSDHRAHHASGDTMVKIKGHIHTTHPDGTVTVSPNRRDRTPPKPSRPNATG